MVRKIKKIQVLGFVISMLAFGAVYSQETPQTYVNKLAENIYHVFVMGYSSVVVISDDGVLITDTGLPPRIPLLKAEIGRLTDKPVTKIVLTHEHYDHVGGVDQFQDAEVICHVACLDTFRLDTLGLAPREVHTTFEDFLRLDIGDTTVELHHWAPADGDAATVVYLPDHEIVMTSDLYEYESLTPPQFIQDKNFIGTRLVLNKIAELDIAHAVNSHSTSTNVDELYAARDYHNDLYDAVTAELKKAQEAGGLFAAFELSQRLPNELKLPKYESWANYEMALPAHIQRVTLGIFHGE